MEKMYRAALNENEMHLLRKTLLYSTYGDCIVFSLEPKKQTQ